MRHIDRTPAATLARARDIALGNGVRYAYTGNVRDTQRSSTWCHVCSELLIERDGYRLGHWGLDASGACVACNTTLPGVFAKAPERSASRPVRLHIH